MASPKDFSPLEFEKPILELEAKIAEIENASPASEDMETLARLRDLATKLKHEIYGNLSPFEKVQIARFERRPQTSDYIAMVFDEFEELHGGKTFREDHSTITGIGRIDDRRVMLVGQEKGKSTQEKVKRNFGCPHPEGYRKALAKMEMAEKFGLPVVTFINTPGAYPGIAAEERGQAYAIAYNLMRMSRLAVPILSIVIGEGGSGGALGIGVGDRLAILEFAYYSVISPEGCSAILWKSNENKREAAEALRLTAPDLKEMGIVDDIIEEPLGGAHRDAADMGRRLKRYILAALNEICAIPSDELLDRRYNRLRNVGVVIEDMPLPEEETSEGTPEDAASPDTAPPSDVEINELDIAIDVERDAADPDEKNHA